MSNYPLSEKAGLTIEQVFERVGAMMGRDRDVIDAVDVERYLASRDVAYGHGYGLARTVPKDELMKKYPSKPSGESVEFFKASDFDSTTGMQLLLRGPVDEHAVTCRDAADKANRLLKERGTVVYGTNISDSGHVAGPNPQWFLSIKREELDTHTALLINITPLAQDSAEENLKAAKTLLEQAKDSNITDLQGALFQAIRLVDDARKKLRD